MRPVLFVALAFASGCGSNYSCEAPASSASECDDYLAGFTESSGRATCEGLGGFFERSGCSEAGRIRVGRCTISCASSGRTVRGNFYEPHTTDEIRTGCVAPSADCSASFEPN